MIRLIPRSRSAFALAALLTTALSACAGPSVPSTLTGEPICADFTFGGETNKMRGGLRQPVRVTILEDDGDTAARAVFFGKRAEGDPNPRVLLPDADAAYKVEWAQCENERASVPLRGSKAADREGTAYECGEAKVYKTDPLATKKGDRASHALTFQPPPNAACWTDERPAEPPPPPAAAPAPEPPDAGAEDAATDAATSADAGTDAGAGKATDAKDKPAEAPKAKPVEAPKPAAPTPEAPRPAATQ